MKKRLMYGICGAVLAFGAALSHAAPITTVGLSILDGDKLFNNFTCTLQSSIQPSAPTTCSAIDVSALAGPDVGITFGGGFNAQNGGLVDFLVGYTVTVLDPTQLISGLSLAMNGTIGGTGGLVNVTETVRSGTTIVGQIFVERSLVTTDLQDPPYEIFDIPLTGTFSTLNVQKDIQVSALPGGTATLSFVDQDYRQLPEPGSLLLLSTILGGVGFAVRRRGSAVV